MVLIKKLQTAYPELKGLTSAAFLKVVTRIARAADMNPDNPAVIFLLKSWERKEICMLADARLLCGLMLIDQLPARERILIFCERISQAERMARLIQRRHGNICAVYHSAMSRDARQRNMDCFRNNMVRILVSCRCLDEGIDVPDASTGIVLSSAAVTRQRIQRLGRILRRAEGKASAALYYLYIQESSEDISFLPGLEAGKTASLRFRSQERSCENDLYVYAAQEVINEAKLLGFQPGQLRELRLCLNEGLARTDYLLDPDLQQEALQQAADAHTRNYWKAMIKIGNAFH